MFAEIRQFFWIVALKFAKIREAHSGCQNELFDNLSSNFDIFLIYNSVHDVVDHPVVMFNNSQYIWRQSLRISFRPFQFQKFPRLNCPESFSVQ